MVPPKNPSPAPVIDRLCAAFKRVDDEILLSPKIIYFIVSTAFYTLYLFRAKFIKLYLGLDADEYGDISAIMALTSFAFMTLWGTFSDILGRHRLVLVVLCVALTGALELSVFVARITNHSLRFYLASAVMTLYSFFACGLLPLADYLTLRQLSNRPGFSRDLYGRQRLWGTISYGLTTAVMGWLIHDFGLKSILYALPLSSAACVITLFSLAPADTPRSFSQIFGRTTDEQDMIKEVDDSDEKDDNFTNQNMSEKKSDIVDRNIYEKKDDATDQGMYEKKEIPDMKAQDQVRDDYPVKPIKSPGSSNSTVPINAKLSTKENRRPFVQLLMNPNYMFMLFVVFMTGSARAVMTTFLGKYWEEGMHLNSKQAAYAANFGIVLEIIIFFFGSACLRVIGTYWMLIIAQLAMVLRCWAYVLLPAPPRSVWLVYAVELLKGVAFGCTQIAGVKLASDAAPKGLEATAQALYTSVYSQLPAVLTAFIGGRVYKHYGPSLLFYVTSIIMTSALVLFILKYLADGSIKILPTDHRKKHQKPHGTP
jgi:predicted MFS family arabinose efflux permease